MKMQTTLALSTAAALSLGTAAGAAVIAEYDFDVDNAASGTPEFPVQSEVGPWNVSPTFLFGSGITSGGGAFSQKNVGDSIDYGLPSGSDSQSVQIGGPKADTTSLADAISNEDFLGFEVSPQTPLDLESFFFTAAAQGENGVIAPEAPERYAVFVGAPGFDASVATPLLTGEVTGFSEQASGNDVPFEQIVVSDISGPAYDFVDDDLEFRIYLWGGDRGAATLIDNVILQGEVVPEPASAAAIGLLGLTALRRRRA